MTLLSLMVVILFSSLKIGAESWNKGENKITAVNEKAVVYRFFKHHLPSIRPLWNDFSDNDPEFSFQGSQNTLQFVSVFPDSAERKGLQLFKVGPAEAEKGVIKVVLTPFYPTLEARQWQPEDEVLLKNVEKFELSYFVKETPDSDAAWSDTWLQKERLPDLIKIKIVLTDHSYWPEMVFALKLASDQPSLPLGLLP